MKEENLKKKWTLWKKNETSWKIGKKNDENFEKKVWKFWIINKSYNKKSKFSNKK